eukprot:841070-Amphidinium_carterae.1
MAAFLSGKVLVNRPTCLRLVKGPAFLDTCVHTFAERVRSSPVNIDNARCNKKQHEFMVVMLRRMYYWLTCSVEVNHRVRSSQNQREAHSASHWEQAHVRQAMLTCTLMACRRGANMLCDRCQLYPSP